jgi:NTE family protein
MSSDTIRDPRSSIPDPRRAEAPTSPVHKAPIHKAPIHKAKAKKPAMNGPRKNGAAKSAATGTPDFAAIIRPYDRVALVLQGGGALGAYQGGVYEALQENHILPNWVAGVSIGAINAALIAGNAPERRCAALREFWATVAPPGAWSPVAEMWRWLAADSPSIGLLNQLSAFRTMIEGQPGFFRPRPASPWIASLGIAGPGGSGATSFYDTTPLKATLERLIDFDRINAGETRLGLGAVNVRTGNYVYFDSTRQKIRAEHVMASGALPPGFPAVDIDGELYWDGGLVSNTPLFHVLEDLPRRNTLVFQVDLWSATGDAPPDMPGVLMRQKDITYSSRTRFNTDTIKYEQTLRTNIAHLLEKLPPALRNEPEAVALRSCACTALINIVHLIYRRGTYESDSSDYEFSHATMRGHWQSGCDDTRATLQHPEWLVLPSGADGTVTHDLARVS